MSDESNASASPVPGPSSSLLSRGDFVLVDHEKRLSSLEARFDAVLPTLATKADVESVRSEVHRAIHELTWKLIGASALLVGGTAVVARTFS